MYDGHLQQSQPIKTNRIQSDLKGINQLAEEGIVGLVDLVESMHQRILSLGGLLNLGDLNQTTGLTRFIYQTIRNTTQLSIKGIDFALSKFSPTLPRFENSKQRQQWLAMINGVLGDHLTASNNPLALDMTWHYQGTAMSPKQVAQMCCEQEGQPLILIHGLCMNDQLWKRHGHDHGIELQKSNNMIPIYLRYNSGLAVYQNGLKLAHMLEQFFSALPPEKFCNVLCHSMGGLVMRSAMHVADECSHPWLEKISKAVFLGTPHQGAVLEKTGNLIDYIISINPYSAPLTKLVKIRSHGIKNLRHGTVTKDHQTIQLPSHVDCYAIAASTKDLGMGDAHHLHLKWIGDGLVSVDSALGGHKHPEREVLFKAKNKITFENVSHMSLLSNKKVFKRLQEIFS